MRRDKSSFLTIFALIFAGEAVFSLPFHVTRFFRPTVLEVFEFSNTQLGDAFAAYGLLAMVAYLLGGPIADRYPPRTLLCASLLLTAAGGLVMAQVPSFFTMTMLYGFWGVSTIFLFWAPLMKATREWGGALAQGRAFGLLDGGRGLVAAASASVAVVLFAWLLPDITPDTHTGDARAALQSIIYFYSGITAFAALIVWWVLPGGENTQQTTSRFPLANIREVIRKPIVWAHAGIIVCAYCAYKGLDNYAVYCVEVLGMSHVEAAQFTSNAAYLRLFGALLVGILADKIGASRAVLGTFIALMACYLFLYQAHPESTGLIILYANLLDTFFAAYAMRGIYYALLEEVRTPYHLTGTTVGLISVLAQFGQFGFELGNALGVVVHLSTRTRVCDFIFWRILQISIPAFPYCNLNYAVLRGNSNIARSGMSPTKWPRQTARGGARRMCWCCSGVSGVGKSAR